MNKPLNRIEFPIRWVDMDLYHHVNNARFFDCMTEARAALFQAIKTDNQICQLVVVDTHCNFKKSYTHPDTIIIEQSLELVGRASFTLRYDFFSQRYPNTLFAEGSAKIVCYDPVLKKAIAIPTAVRDFL